MPSSRLPAAILVMSLLAAPTLLAQGANYGAAVAASAQEVFVAEPLNDYAPGAVYLYQPVTAADRWRRSSILNAPSPVNGDRFGSSLALDGNRLVVGAPAADSGRGAAFLYVRDNAGAWHSRGKLVAEDGTAKTGLGGRVALSGDLAAATASGGDSAAGVVYLFRRSGDNWTQIGRLSSWEATKVDAFGSAIALQGDQLFVGASQADSSRGEVFVFQPDSTGKWTQAAKLKPARLDVRARVGNSLAVSGKELFVGAPGAMRTGEVFVFKADSTGNWTESERLLPFSGAINQSFGSSIAVAGREVWVGAPGLSRNLGGVYRMTRDSAGMWTGSTAMMAPGAKMGDRLGYGGAIALAGRHAVIVEGSADFGEGKAVLLSRGTTGAFTADLTVVGESKGLSAIKGNRVECTRGSANIFGCNATALMSFMPVRDIGGARGIEINDIWGWTDPATRREYALVGRLDGTSFVDVTDPLNPRYLGNLPKTERANSAIWRDIKVYKHYAFIVSDGAGEHGMQILDLDKLGRVRGGPVTFTEDAHYDRIHSAHNIVIDTLSGYAYAVGSSSGGETCGGGLHMIDIRDPLHPAFAGCFADPTTGRAGTGYIHDAQCTMYHGPDQKYQGRELCFSAAETALSIADVTDKSHPSAISHTAYPNVGYAHQGWLTADQKYFYMDDELDELQGKVEGTRTLIWDVSSLTDPVLAGQYVSQDHAIDHNLYVVGDSVYQSNYLSGLRVLDISNRTAPREVAYFDTVPVGEDVAEFGGSWSNYPFFTSGTIIVTSMKEGLFLLRTSPAALTP
ncbi:MAG: choice-of-anchor B family protein [Gemmatimonadota bacterium]